MGSHGIEADKIRFPDLSLSLTEAFQKIMDEFCPSMSTSSKRHPLAQVPSGLSFLQGRPALKSEHGRLLRSSPPPLGWMFLVSLMVSL